MNLFRRFYPARLSTLPCLALAVLLAPVAFGQIRIDKLRPAGATTEVHIKNAFGSVVVTGWDRKEVQVTGTLAAGAKGLDLDGDAEHTDLSVYVPDAWFYESDDDSEYQSHLEIHVPRGGAVSVETTNAYVTLTGVNGAVEVESTNGNVKVTGGSPSVEVQTLTGSVDIDVQRAEIEVESISGDVRVRGARKSLGVITTSSRVDVQGEALEEVELETNSGDIRFQGTFLEEGDFSLETHQGNVELILSPDVKAQFEMVTFSGQIVSDLGPRPSREGRFDPYQKLRFSTGFNDFEVEVNTFSGNITLSTGGTK